MKLLNRKNTKKKISGALVLSILLVNLIFAFVVIGQNFYNKAMKSKSIAERISLLNQAIKIDPARTKAYVALGRAYKQQGDLVEAEKYLQRALIANPAELNQNLRFEIIFEIGVIQRALGQLARANDSFLAAKRLTNDAKMLADIYFNLGGINLELEKIDDAFDYFVAGRRFAPNDTRFTSRIEQIQEERKLYQAYLEGNKHFTFQRFEEAIAAYQKVMDVNPDFKDTREKINEADKKLKEKRRVSSKRQLEKQYVQGVDYLENRQRVNEKELIGEDTTVETRQTAREQNESVAPQETVNHELENAFQRGLQYFNVGNWSAAIRQFEKVYALNPDYRDVGRRLTQARNRLQNERLTASKQRLYEEARLAMDQEDWNGAMTVLDQLLSIEPGYKDAVDLLKQAQAAMDVSLRDDWQNNYYEKGIRFMEQKNWIEARIAFEKVVVVDSNYKNVQNLLEETKARLKTKTVRDQNTNADTTAWRTVLISLISVGVLLIAGIVVVLLIQPRVLGEYYFKHQQFDKAAAVFEKIWRKNAGDPANNARLAEIYFRQKREDAQAIRVYEAVILNDLNLPIKSEISTIVAYHYLSNGNTDAEKIEILEKVMNQEINKIKATRGR